MHMAAIESVVFHVATTGVVSNSNQIAAVSSLTYANSVWLTPADADWLEFSRLAAVWRDETKYMSSIEDMADTEPFRKIVALGARRAVPVILHQLQLELDTGLPRHWWRVLQELVGQNPVPPQLMNDLVEGSRFWLEWARQHYGIYQGTKVVPQSH